MRNIILLLVNTLTILALSNVIIFKLWSDLAHHTDCKISTLQNKDGSWQHSSWFCKPQQQREDAKLPDAPGSPFAQERAGTTVCPHISR